MIKTAKYYLNHAQLLGWGQGMAKIDKEREELIKKYVVGKKVLDIGCGFGVYINLLSDLGYEATGIDFVGDFIKYAKQNNKGKFIKGSANKLPFKDKEFDTVLMFDILEHGDDSKLLKEAKRVCKQKILVIVPKKVLPDLENSGVVYKHYIDKSHLREYENADLKKLARTLKLKTEFIKDIHPLYNETIFLALFSGSLFFKKVIRKLVFLILPKKIYPTELFSIFKRV